MGINKYFVLTMIFCSIFPGCFGNEVKLTKIDFLYPDSFYYEPFRGKILNNWGDVPQGYNLEHDVDNKPKEVDLLFTVDNQSSVSYKNSKVFLEFWIFGTNRVPANDNLDYDEFLERLEKDSKWYKVWEKEVIIDALKPYEKREVKLKNLGLNIYELIDKAPGEHNLAIKLKIIGKLEKTKAEKVIDFHISY